MYKYGKKSTHELSTCSFNIKRVFHAAIKIRDISVTEGHRTNQRQHMLFLEGKSKLDAGESEHNYVPSRAIDAHPWPITKEDWENREFWVEWSSWLKGFASGMGITLISGFDWDNDYDLDDQTFYDGPHFQEE